MVNSQDTMQESVIDAPSSQGTATQLHGEVSENLGEHSPWSSLAPGLTASSTHEACVHHALGRGLQSFCTCRARGSLRPRSFDEQSPDSQSQQTAAVCYSPHLQQLEHLPLAGRRGVDNLLAARRSLICRAGAGEEFTTFHPHSGLFGVHTAFQSWPHATGQADAPVFRQLHTGGAAVGHLRADGCF